MRAVSRHRPPGLADGIDWCPADATDAGAASDAAKGAAVVYQCLNAPYAQWPERFPPLQSGVLIAAERAGALLVSLFAIGRASDFFGAGVTGGSTLGERVFGNALAGRRAAAIAATIAWYRAQTSTP